MVILTSIKITLRLPVAVHQAINKAAKESGRSLNTEIIERLNQSLGNPYLSEKNVDDDVIIRITDLEARVAELEKRKKDRLSQLGGPTRHRRSKADC
jgi:hypothetical protein